MHAFFRMENLGPTGKPESATSEAIRGFGVTFRDAAEEIDESLLEIARALENVSKSLSEIAIALGDREA